MCSELIKLATFILTLHSNLMHRRNDGVGSVQEAVKLVEVFIIVTMLLHQQRVCSGHAYILQITLFVLYIGSLFYGFPQYSFFSQLLHSSACILSDPHRPRDSELHFSFDLQLHLPCVRVFRPAVLSSAQR